MVPIQHAEIVHVATVALAVSGGVDSMALALLCHQARRCKPMLKISDKPVRHWYAYIVDHRLRDGSGQEAENVKAVLDAKTSLMSMILPLSWKAVPGDSFSPAHLPNVETIARRLRYRRMASVGSHSKLESLLLGHHQDDQYETVLMRLISGHGYRGLQGMRPASEVPECGDMHGAFRSGFVDDRARHKNDPSALREESFKGMTKGGRRVPVTPLTTMHMEQGGIITYRPLLEFSKDRLMATCLENDMPWFEDCTNTDPTFTMRNAVRNMVQNHTLPSALRKPAILRLAENCQRRCAAEEAAADRLLLRTTIFDFEPNVGTLVVQLPRIRLPRRPISSLISPYRRRRRLEHYRLHAALLIRRLMSLVTPEEDMTPVGNMDYLVSLLFPSLATAEARKEAKGYVISGLHFIPLVREQPLRWCIARAPHVSSLPRPAARFTFSRQSFRHRSNKPASARKWRGWSQWKLFDGRYWVRIRTRLAGAFHVANLEPEHQKPFREGLDVGASQRLSLLLTRYAPGKVRYTLPAIYSDTYVDDLLAGHSYWPTELSSTPGSLAPATPPLEMRVRMQEWERERNMSYKQKLLALPTLNVQLPGLERWLQWEMRYRMVDSPLLRKSASNEHELPPRDRLRAWYARLPKGRRELLSRLERRRWERMRRWWKGMNHEISTN